MQVLNYFSSEAMQLSQSAYVRNAICEKQTQSHSPKTAFVTVG